MLETKGDTRQCRHASTRVRGCMHARTERRRGLGVGGGGGSRSCSSQSLEVERNVWHLNPRNKCIFLPKKCVQKYTNIQMHVDMLHSNKYTAHSYISISLCSLLSYFPLLLLALYWCHTDFSVFNVYFKS